MDGSNHLSRLANPSSTLGCKNCDCYILTILPYSHSFSIPCPTNKPSQVRWEAKPPWSINLGFLTKFPQTEDVTWMICKMFRINKKEVLLPWLNFSITSPWCLRILTDEELSAKSAASSFIVNFSSLFNVSTTNLLLCLYLYKHVRPQQEVTVKSSKNPLCGCALSMPSYGLPSPIWCLSCLTYNGVTVLTS